MPRTTLKSIIYCGIAGLFLALLTTLLLSVNSGKLNPHSITTPEQITVPETNAIALDGYKEFDAKELTEASMNKPILLSFFASWCVPCVEEMATLKTVSKDVTIWAIAYQDKPERAIKFINRNNNPFARAILDKDGRTGIEWHVTGVPENFLVYKGKIILHEIGGLDGDRLEAVLKTLEK